MSKVFLDDLLGIPFKDGGDDKTGIDCYNLGKEIYKRYGIELPKYLLPCFDTKTINREVLQGLRDNWEKIDEVEEPCAVVMKGIDPRFPKACTHIGVYVGDGFFMHTLRNRTVLRERLNHPLFILKIIGFYRYVGNTSK